MTFYGSKNHAIYWNSCNLLINNDIFKGLPNYSLLTKTQMCKVFLQESYTMVESTRFY